MLDQPAADQRGNGGGNGARRRPGADRLAARLAFEGAVEQGEAVGQQQRRADPLQGAAGEQRFERAGDGANQRGDAEQRSTDHQP